MQLPKRRIGRKIVKKDEQPADDELLFQQEMEGVVPLKVSPISDSKAPRGRMRRHDPLPGAGLSHRPETSPGDCPAVGPGDQGGSHHKDGIQKKVLQKLKRGHFPVSDQLDLHHMSSATAQQALLDFIAQAQRHAYECVRVIHGKGLHSASGPRLRMMARELLRHHPQVLAFAPCKPVDGGTGATDILLKRNV